METCRHTERNTYVKFWLVCDCGLSNSMKHRIAGRKIGSEPEKKKGEVETLWLMDNGAKCPLFLGTFSYREVAGQGGEHHARRDSGKVSDWPGQC